MFVVHNSAKYIPFKNILVEASNKTSRSYFVNKIKSEIWNENTYTYALRTTAALAETHQLDKCMQKAKVNLFSQEDSLCPPTKAKNCVRNIEASVSKSNPLVFERYARLVWNEVMYYASQHTDQFSNRAYNYLQFFGTLEGILFYILHWE